MGKSMTQSAITAGQIVRCAKADRSRTPEQAFAATGREQYVDNDVVATMPRGKGANVETVFFKLPPSETGGYISDDDLEKEFKFQNLKPEHPDSLAAINEADPAFATSIPTSLTGGVRTASGTTLRSTSGVAAGALLASAATTTVNGVVAGGPLVVPGKRSGFGFLVFSLEPRDESFHPGSASLRRAEPLHFCTIWNGIGFQKYADCVRLKTIGSWRCIISTRTGKITR